jgi:formate--tetrahydrofolate ligase
LVPPAPETKGDLPANFLYPDNLPLLDKITTIAKQIYRAKVVTFSERAQQQAAQLTELGFASLPVCIAKTPSSFSANSELRGAPEGFSLPITGLKLQAGAGFITAFAENILTMPGLPTHPAAANISVTATGDITGIQ